MQRPPVHSTSSQAAVEPPAFPDNTVVLDPTDGHVLMAGNMDDLLQRLAHRGSQNGCQQHPAVILHSYLNLAHRLLSKSPEGVFRMVGPSGSGLDHIVAHPGTPTATRLADHVAASKPAST
jgi:hypothetical protein